MTASHTKYDIYSIGNALLDTEIEVSDADLERLGIEKGVMTLVDDQRQADLVSALDGHMVTAKRASGGSAANSVIAATYFGAKTYYSCRVANDDNGTYYLNDLRAAGVDYHLTNGTQDGVTGKCLVLISPDAERSMNTYLGVSESMSLEDIDEQALKQSRYVYIEGYLVTSATALPAAIRVRELAQQHRVKSVVTLSDPAIVKHFLEPLKQVVGDGVDMIFCNAQEALQFTGTGNIEHAIEKLKNHAKTFAITRGKDGAVLFDGEQTINIAAHQVKAIDANGAGDMFAGAFLSALCAGQSFEQAGKLASMAAAKVVSQYGPRLRPEQHQELLNSLSA